MESSPRSRPATVQKNGSANAALSSEANGTTASTLRKEAKNSRRPSQKSLRGKQLDRSDGGDAPSHSYASAVNQSEAQADHVARAVEQPSSYTEVIENSSCHPVARDGDIAGVPTRGKVPGDSISGSATAAGSGVTAAFRDNPQQLDPNDFPSVTEVAEKTRKAQKQLAAARNGDNSKAARHSLSQAPSAFVNRVASIPAVAETVHLLTNSVGSITRRNRVAKIAVDTTKQAATIGVTIADKLATPVKPALGSVIQKFDGRAADLLEKGLRKYPIISKQPSEIASQVRNTAVYTADNTVHRVLAYKPASFVASLTAKTVLSMNRGVDTVLHKTRLQDPDTHTQLYNTVDWLGNGVLHIVDESRSGHWQRSALEVA